VGRVQLLIGELELSLLLLLLVRQRVVSEVNTLHFVVEQVLEVNLPFGLLNGLDACNAFSLMVKLITMVTNFVCEETCSFFAQVFVFSLHLNKHCLYHRLEVFILHGLGFLTHGCEVHV